MSVERDKIVKAVATLTEAIKTNESRRIIKELNIKFEIINSDEEWRDIEGYNGEYKISNKCRVVSLKCNNFYIMSPGRDSQGYYTVALTKNGNPKSHLLHVLLAKAFIPNPENKPVVNHKDGNKINNSLDNLEWVTYKENNEHAYAIGLKKPCQGTRHKSAKLSDEAVKFIRKYYKPYDKDFNRKVMARLFNVSISVIGSLISGKSYSNVE